MMKSSSVNNKPLPADDLRRVVEQVGDVWEQLLAFSNKTLVVTGSRGFIGRWMLESLQAKYYHGRDLNIEQVDYAVEKWWPRQRPDYIIHATTDGVGWQHVAAVARAAGARMLLLSSGAVYNQQWSYRQRLSNGQINAKEEWWTCNVAPDQWPSGYAYDKAQQEHECRDVAVIARLFTFIGPGLRRHTGREFLEADPITVNDDGAVRSYLYASDMAAFCWRTLLLGQIGRAYNVGSGEAIDVVDFARRCSDARKQLVDDCPGGQGCYWKKVPVSITTATDGTYYVPDVSRAERELGCRQTVGLDDAIRRTLAWNKSA